MSFWMYLAVMYAVSFALGYELAFTRATLYLGREAIGAQVGTGLQDAVTPPRSNLFAFATYGLCLAGVVFGWYRFGWIVGLGCAVGLLFVARLNMTFLPKPEGLHFRRLLIGSLMRRYADYKRDSDEIRADAIADILGMLGSSPPERHDSS